MPQLIDKPLVARRFGRRAGSYEAATPVQAAMAQDLHAYARARLAEQPVRNILELGCGSGRLTRMLHASWPGAHIVSVDIAADMVALAQRHSPDVEFVVADAEAFLQGCGRRFDLIISNATMQWFQTPETTLPRCRALLNPGGLAALTTFGGDTFCELRAAFAEAYQRSGRPPRQHAGEFPGPAFWRGLLPGAELEERYEVQHFADVRSFLRSVQQAGATNAFAPQGAIPRDVLRLMQAIYSECFPGPDGHGIRGTYHLLRIGLVAP